MVRRIAQYLNEFPDRPIEVAGHTDSVGSAAFNQQLSEQRAQDVASLLEANGVDSSRIKVKGYGEWKPIAPNANVAGRQQNRRVEIILLNPAPKPPPRQGT
jgi:outer membrane protein OmpA-like peptidoglycan-associated protein